MTAGGINIPVHPMVGLLGGQRHPVTGDEA
jgi:hypothetical protein